MSDLPAKVEESTITIQSAGQPRPLRSYLLVIDGNSATMFHLPASGEVIIGRARDAHLQLQDHAASRRHARLCCGPGSYALCDLGSHNGTWVNGERLCGPRVLASRDAITICDATLFFYRDASEGAGPSPVSAANEAAPTVQVGGRTVVIADPAMSGIFSLLRRLARSDLSVLLCGETGTGKEIAAAALHDGSRRGTERLLTLNCAALAESMAEGELFGYEKGAFSGAVSAKPGLVELADKGTLFLDEVGELSLTMQAKLLRVLETRQVMRLGGVREHTVDVRIVSATNRKLEDEVNAGRFRQDLLFRLSGAVVTLVPLRDRKGELPHLARLFLSQACARDGRGHKSLSVSTMQKLDMCSWPGNVRQLKNAMDYVASTCPEAVIEPWHLPAGIVDGPPAKAGPPAPDGAAGFRPLEGELREIERTRIAEALRAAGGVQTRAAELLSMPLRTFTGKVKLYGLSAQANTRRNRTAE